MHNHLKNQTSPYLLQHAQNPVDWYPWCEEAFERARQENKPVFLSIGYSTCHWCHVMAHESFENEEIADILNRYFISVKVDREERPDIDSVYMSVCQALSGSGGWPLSIFMTPGQEPFYAGTYFPPVSVHGMMGLKELLLAIAGKWESAEAELSGSARHLIDQLGGRSGSGNAGSRDVMAGNARTCAQERSQWENIEEEEIDSSLPAQAVKMLVQSFDEECGGFGQAPKFPMAHNLIFLMLYSYLQQTDGVQIAGVQTDGVQIAGMQTDGVQIAGIQTDGVQATEMQAGGVQADRVQATGETDTDKILGQVKMTLDKMRRGGIFDHIGHGFSRYSTDCFYLVPHFEKMLYDNALLIIAYAVAYRLTGERDFLDTAEQTAEYILREMTGENGGFYSAQDADSEGEEGKYYVWNYQEICDILGEEEGKRFCEYFSITRQGNFEGKNIPNLLSGGAIRDDFGEEKEKLYQYRKSRYSLHVDDKILTSWNALMIGALAILYRVSGKAHYLEAAKRGQQFIEEHLAKGNLLFASCRGRVRSGNGFLDDYAYYGASLMALYDATADSAYLQRAEEICQEAKRQFADGNDGYFLSGNRNQELIIRPKETYDGALPSGNSMMAYLLVRLSWWKQEYALDAKRQLAFLSAQSAFYPAGHCLFGIALLHYFYPPMRVTVVLARGESAEQILLKMPLLADIVILREETDGYKLLHGETTYYVCKGHTCLPPANQAPFCTGNIS